MTQQGLRSLAKRLKESEEAKLVIHLKDEEDARTCYRRLKCCSCLLRCCFDCCSCLTCHCVNESSDKVSKGTFTIKRVNGDLRVKKDESYIFKETKGGMVVIDKSDRVQFSLDLKTDAEPTWKLNIFNGFNENKSLIGSIQKRNDLHGYTICDKLNDVKYTIKAVNSQIHVTTYPIEDEQTTPEPISTLIREDLENSNNYIIKYDKGLAKQEKAIIILSVIGQTCLSEWQPKVSTKPMRRCSCHCTCFCTDETYMKSICIIVVALIAFAVLLTFIFALLAV